MKKIIILVTGASVLIGCSQYSEPQGLNNGNTLVQKGSADVVLEATFASIKTNIIDVKCLNCHKTDSESKAKDIPFETEAQILNGYSDLGALVVPGRPAESLFYRSIVKDPKIRGRAKQMPPKESSDPAVTATEQHVIAAWIAGVAVKIEGAPSPTQPDVLPEAVNFAFLKAEVLEKKCMTCHKVGGKSEDLAFSTREELLALKNSVDQPFIVAGKPEESIFYLSVLKDENLRQDVMLMPPKKYVVAGKAIDVVDRDVALIRQWIANGAK